MKRGVRPFRQIGLVLAVIILGGLAFGPQVAPTFATDDTVFATPKDPHGVAAGFDPTGTRPRIYVTSCRNPRRIVYIESDGRERRFHTLPNRSGDCVRDDIAVAPGGKLDAFGENYVFVTQANVIYKITPDGRTRTTFATIDDPLVPTDACTAVSSYITFDDIGTPGDANTFENDMLAVCSGQVWRIKPNGTVVFVANTAQSIQGPAVVPESFAPAPGQLLVAVPSTGNILSVSPGGVVNFVASWSGAKELHVSPAQVCGLGPVSQPELDRASFFMARTARDEIRRLKKSVFDGQGGRVLVTSDGLFGNATEIGAFSGSSVVAFHTLNFAQDGGSAEFCPRLRVKIFIKPGTYRRYEPESNGKIPVVIFGTDSFDVTKIQESTLRFGDTGDEPSFSHCDSSLQDVNGDGFLDRKCHFNFGQTQLDPTDTQAWLTGFINPPFEGND